MRRAILAGFLAVVVAVFVWMASGSRDESEAAKASPGKTEAPVAKPAELAPAPERASDIEVATAAEDAPRRQVAITEVPEPSAAPKDEELATVLVRVFAKESGRPALGMRLIARPAEATSWGTKDVDGHEAVLGEAPQTDVNGEARFRLEPGSYRIGPERSLVDGSDELVEDLRPGESRELRFELPLEFDLEVYARVVADEDGAPVVGATIELRMFASDREETEVRTGFDGSVFFRAPSWQRVSARVTAEGFGPLLFTIESHNQTPETAREIRLRRGATLLGYVVDHDGNPWSGINVTVSVSAYKLQSSQHVSGFAYSGGAESFSAATGADGSFRLPGLPPDVDLPVELRNRYGHVKHTLPNPVRLSPGEEREIRIDLASGARITGIAFGPDGAPFKRRRLWLSSGKHPYLFTRSTKMQDTDFTDREGRFQFGHVQPGFWLIGPAPRPNEKAGYAPYPTAIEVPRGVAEVDVVVHVPSAYFVSGRVVGPDDEPVGSVSVFASGPAGSADGDTEEDGSFRVGPLLAGSVTLRVMGMWEGYANAEPLELQAGDEKVIVRLGRGGALRGRVVDAQSGEGLQAELVLTRSDAASTWTGQVLIWTSLKGEFDRNGLAPGSYVVIARTADDKVGAARAVPVQVGDAGGEIEIRVAPGARVRLRVPADSGAQSFRVRWEGVVVEQAVSGGRTEFLSKTFPPGQVTVELLGPDGEVAAEKTLVATAEGEELEVELP